MHKEEFEGSRIVVEIASKLFLTIEARSRRDSNDRGRGRDRERDRDRDREPRRRGPQAEDKCFNCDKTGHWYGS